MHEHGTDIEMIDMGLKLIEARGPMPAIDRCTLWLDLTGARDRFDAVLRDVAADATDALSELLDDDDDGPVETSSGLVHRVHRRGYDRWHGHDLVNDLGRRMIEQTSGEIVRAVPVDVLRRVLPGCDKPEATSSRWLRRVKFELPADRQLDEYLQAGGTIVTIGRGAPFKR